MVNFKTVRGMRDFKPKEAQIMRCLEEKARKTANLYGYKEIITPIVEYYDLLTAKTGEEIRSRLYLFKDLGDRSVALRPEFTASVARLIATTLKKAPKPLRLFCVGSLYRYDEPQKGRFREFWQSNFELVGSNKPEADVEILMLTNDMLQMIGLRDYAFKIGHIGILKGLISQEDVNEKTQNMFMQLMDKKEYEKAVKLIISAGISDRCLEIIKKLIQLKGENIFSTINGIIDYVKDYKDALRAAVNLKEIVEIISKSSSSINLIIDASFARGLEYYTGMIFEVYIPELNIALGGGGRYDKLIEVFGGESSPSVGVAHGIDRLMLALQQQNINLKTGKDPDVVVIPVKSDLNFEALNISLMLRKEGVPVELEVMRRKIPKALKDADRRKKKYAIIIGEKELKEESIMLKDLVKREQKIVKIKEIKDILKINR